MSRFSFDLTLTFNRFGLPWYEAHRLLALETVVITLYGMTTTDSLSGGETTTNSFEDIQVILQELLIMLIHPLNLGNSSDRQFALSPAFDSGKLLGGPPDFGELGKHVIYLSVCFAVLTFV